MVDSHRRITLFRFFFFNKLKKKNFPPVNSIGVTANMADTIKNNAAVELEDTNKFKEDEIDENVHSVLKNFAGFNQKRILNDNSQRKTICVHGSFKDKEGEAIILLEKKPFNEDSVNAILDDSVLRKEFSNDIYGFYECFPALKFNGIKATIIHPATEKHIKKYESQPLHIIEESPELYTSITLPYLEREKFSLQWVKNILEHKSETERIVFEDPNPDNGFILLPDLKWDGKQINDLYLIAIVHKEGIKSLRELSESHLALLQNIKSKGCKAIEEKYKIPSSQLRIYIHYQPSYYHLHIHFTHLKYEAPGITAERAHVLASVISNIELMSNYYQKATLPFIVKETDKLFEAYEEKGVVRRIRDD